MLKILTHFHQMLLLILLLILSLGGGVGLCLLTGAFDSLHWLWQIPVGFAGSFLVFAALAFGFLVLVCKAVDLEPPGASFSDISRSLEKSCHGR